MKLHKITATLTLSLLLATSLLSPPAYAAEATSPELENKASSKYEAMPVQYQYDDQAQAPTNKIDAPRFIYQNGIYRNPKAKKTNNASLMITGDLMCQYRQQTAVFQSDGKPYMTAEEVNTHKSEVDKAHAAALEERKKAEEALKHEGEAAGQNQPVTADKPDTSSSPTTDAQTAPKPTPVDPSADKPTPTAPTTPSTDGQNTPATDEQPTTPDTDEQPSPTKPVLPVVPPIDYGLIPQPTGTWDFSGSFTYVKDILQQGDLVIGNLETMLSQSSPLGMQLHRLEDKPYLNAPISYLDALKEAGYDLLTMANNHNCDTGVRGLRETIANVDHYKFMHTGLFADADTPRYLLVDVNGIKIGIVAYATYFNQKDDNFTEAGQDTLLNRFTYDTACADIAAARDAGAEFVIAFMHWGKENTNETTYNQERYARSVAKAGADYIVGSHPHALQRWEIIETNDDREVPVIYSMGNFISHMRYTVNNDTVILRLNLVRDETGKVVLDSHRLYPCKVYESLTVADPAAGNTAQLFLPTKTVTLHHVAVPYAEDFNDDILNDKHTTCKITAIDDKTPATLPAEIMIESYDRITKVFINRLMLPLPYTDAPSDDQVSLLPRILPNLRFVIKNRK